MENTLTVDGFTIRLIELEREVNFEVNDDAGYCCRLVPTYAGFEISKLDRALGNEPDRKLTTRLSDLIVQHYA